MLAAIGIFLILFGFASILVGDKRLNTKNGGAVLRFLSTSRGVAKWRKWAIGLAAIFAGVMILADVVSSFGYWG